MYKLIKWHNVDDKELNNPSKYVVLKENVQSPSTVGLDPDLEYFIVDTPFSEPEYDPRLVFITAVNTMSEELIEGFRSWVITFEVTERTADEKKISIEEKESEQNFNIITLKKQLKYLAIYSVIIKRRLSGYTITDKMVEIEDLVEAKAMKIWQNHITALAKMEAVDSNNPINLDEDWQDESN